MERIYTIGYNIATHDINVIIEHLLDVPRKSYEHSTLNFFLGGNPHLGEDIYSEVYWVTLINHIGIAGLMLFLAPLQKIFGYLKNKGKYGTGLLLLALLYISLFHYSVFMVGVNILMASVPFIYYFAQYPRLNVNFQEKNINPNS